MSKFSRIIKWCIFPALLVAIGILSGSSFASEPERFQDPKIIEEELTALLSTGNTKDLGARAATLVGTPEQASSFATYFSVFNGKKAQFSEVIVDKTYGSSIRQIVTYMPYDDYTFLYVRYNFKRMSSGWIMVRYDFKTETPKLFPDGLLE